MSSSWQSIESLLMAPMAVQPRHGVPKLAPANSEQPAAAHHPKVRPMHDVWDQPSNDPKPQPKQGIPKPKVDTSQIPPDGPPGLESLSEVDGLLIRQKIELQEVMTGFETENRYTIYNTKMAPVLHVREESNCCKRCCCSSMRSLDLDITDTSGRPILHFYRPFRCNGCCPCCSPCCMQSMEIQAPPGNVIATVQQRWSCFKLKIAVKDTDGNRVLNIIGPKCPSQCLGKDIIYKVTDEKSGIEVAQIRKLWSGFSKEVFTDADSFCLLLANNMDVEIKAALLGALFMIDLINFDN